MARSRAVLPALGDLTKKHYARAIERAFGDPEPTRIDFKRIEAMPESMREITRNAVVRYWSERHEPEKGRQIAKRIPATQYVERVRRFPDEGETAQFERAIAKLEPVKARPIIRVALYAGLRSEELLSLPREEIANAMKRPELLVLGKGLKERLLPSRHLRPALQALLDLPAALPHSTRDQVRMHRQNGHYEAVQWEYVGEILSSPGSSLRTQQNLFARYVKRVAKLAGLDPKHWSPHKLRHAYASRMTRDGAPAPVVQAALGHADLATTMRYVHVTTADIAKYGRGR